ncbi:MAG: LmbU family transcriptional regulator [Streptosporangiaceae bacterium]|nr:LmbU family transcriptional regulator [Streptosporangiaceae bacterium]
MPRTGIQLPRQLPFERWVSIGRQLSAAATSSAWCLGDWLIYGEDAYCGRYRDAIEQTSLDYQTLRNYAWVVRRFRISRRRDTLSFGHHAEVAALAEPEQDFWLRKAEELGWSRNQLRREVRASLSERSESENPGKPAGSPVDREMPQDGQRIQVKLTSEQLELCREAAAEEGLSIETWAAVTLHQVARNATNGGVPAQQVAMSVAPLAACFRFRGQGAVPARVRCSSWSAGPRTCRCR